LKFQSHNYSFRWFECVGVDKPRSVEGDPFSDLNASSCPIVSTQLLSEVQLVIQAVISLRSHLGSRISVRFAELLSLAQ